MSNELTNNEKILTDKVKFFYDNKLIVHITLSRGGWERGTIEELKDGFLKLIYFPEIQKKKGKEFDWFMILEIKDIQEYSPRSYK